MATVLDLVAVAVVVRVVLDNLALLVLPVVLVFQVQLPEDLQFITAVAVVVRATELRVVLVEMVEVVLVPTTPQMVTPEQMAWAAAVAELAQMALQLEEEALVAPAS